MYLSPSAIGTIYGLVTVDFKRQELMEMAKIIGLATYHRCIRDLDRFGYIRYQPSFNPDIRSQVVLFPGVAALSI